MRQLLTLICQLLFVNSNKSLPLFSKYINYTSLSIARNAAVWRSSTLFVLCCNKVNSAIMCLSVVLIEAMYHL